MISTGLSKEVLALPEAERLELARNLIESVAADHDLADALAQGTRRIEDVVTGRVAGLSEAQFRATRR